MQRKITLNSIKQLSFTLREVIKIVSKTNLRLLISMFIVSGLWGLSSVPGFYIQKLILDTLFKAIGNPNWQHTLIVIGELLSITVILDFLRNTLSGFSNYLRRSLSRIFSSKVELLIGQKLAQLDLATIEDPEFQNKFNKVHREAGNRAWNLILPLSDIPNYLVGFLSVVVVLVFLSPLVAVGILVFSLPQLFINSRFIKKDYELDTKLSSSYRLWGWINYYLIRNQSFMELKILDLTTYLSTRLGNIQEDVNKQIRDFQKKRWIAGLGGGVPLQIFEFAFSVWLAFLVLVGKITIGSFTFYLQSIRSAESNFEGLVGTLLEVYENYIYVADLVWFLNLEPNIKLESGQRILDSNSFSIEFKDVWFRYREKQKWTIKGISFSVQAGEKLAMVGLNGAGKSTIIKLLARFYDPQRGEILVNGINLKDYDLSLWRKKLAVLFQEFETYPFSAYESVGYGDVERIDKKEEIRDAIAKTGMDGFIEGLPNKYDNPLEPEFDKGVKPSVGQRQRLGISRMIFRKNAGVIIMDEPTSSVDPDAEEKIFKELVELAKGKILIFVTQRFSTVRLADRVIVIDRGKVVEAGTHKELMKENGEYARLFKLQAKGYE